MTFKQFIENKSMLEWVKPCWIHAINKTLNVPDKQIQELGVKNGWDGKSSGAPIHIVISIVWDLIGKAPDLTLTKAAKGMTPKEVSSSNLVKNKTGLVFTKQHVMPLVNGQVSNFNGHGEEQILAIATFDPKDKK